MKNSPNHQHTSIRILSPQADDIWGVIENNFYRTLSAQQASHGTGKTTVASS